MARQSVHYVIVQEAHLAQVCVGLASVSEAIPLVLLLVWQKVSCKPAATKQPKTQRHFVFIKFVTLCSIVARCASFDTLCSIVARCEKYLACSVALLFWSKPAALCHAFAAAMQNHGSYSMLEPIKRK